MPINVHPPLSIRPNSTERVGKTSVEDALSRVTVVVGIRLSRDRPHCAERLSYLLQWTSNYRLSDVIVVDTTPRANPRRLGLVQKCRRFGAAYHHQPSSLHSPSRVRNAGFRIARSRTSSHVLFLDVDVLGQKGALSRLARHITEDRDFEWCPVIFTDEDNGLGTMKRFVQDRCTSYTGPIYQKGYATGIHLISKRFWDKVGGYDEAFVGYGCEDIDMIHRATALLGQREPSPRGSDYFEDYRTTIPSDYRGYRLWMMEQKKHVSPNQMWVHFHHSRRAGSKYWEARKANDMRLRRKLSAFDESFPMLTTRESFATPHAASEG